MLLEDRVAIVSGVGPGVGRSVALALAREGANVVLGARTEERLREVGDEIEGLGRKVIWRVTDITSEHNCRALADSARESFGRIDVLVNNAFRHQKMAPIEATSPNAFRRAFEVNVLGSLAMTRAVIPTMKEAGRGSVVFVNTLSARQGWMEEGAYATSKGGLLTAARALARELGPFGIRVNSVLPGHIWGPSLEWWFGELAAERGVTPEDVYDEVARDMAMKRIPTSDEVADAVVFFASDLSSAVTGQTLDVNAGQYFG